MMSEKAYSNQSTDKALDIIELLAVAEEPLRLQTIAERLNMNASTALRFINSLKRRGYVMQENDTPKYYLSMKICSLSYNVLKSNNIAKLAAPYLASVSEVFRECACLSKESDMSVLYIGMHDGPDRMLRTFSYIGKVAPMHCTGSGKLFLMEYNQERIEEYYLRKGLPMLTPHTITSLPRLMDELRKIHGRGYSLDDEECELGTRCVAVPVRDYTGRIVAAMSVTGPSNRMTQEKIDAHIDSLIEAADGVSKLLGYVTE